MLWKEYIIQKGGCKFIGGLISNNNDGEHFYSGYKLDQNAVDVDDGRGSVKIKYLLNKLKANNTVIVVVRKFGGIHIGEKRWFCVERVCIELLKNMILFLLIILRIHLMLLVPPYFLRLSLTMLILRV